MVALFESGCLGATEQLGVIAEFVPKRTLSSIEERGAGISQRAETHP